MRQYLGRYIFLLFLHFFDLVTTEDESKGRELSNAQLPNVKLYVVVACIAALVLVAIIQASCTIFKMSRRGSSVQKVGCYMFSNIRKSRATVSQHPTPTNMNPFMSIVWFEWILTVAIYPHAPSCAMDLLLQTSCFSRLTRPCTLKRNLANLFGYQVMKCGRVRQLNFSQPWVSNGVT